MKKQIVGVTCSIEGKIDKVNLLMLTHKGLGMHQEYKGTYTLTHISSGYAVKTGEMSYKQARKLVELVAEMADWTQEINVLMRDRLAISKVWDKVNEAYGEVRKG